MSNEIQLLKKNLTKGNEKEYLKKAKEVTKDAELTDKGIWFPSVELKFAFVKRI